MEHLIEGLKKRIAPWYKNLKGWQTDRKIVVIESDDWGSIRLPSKGTLKNLEQLGVKTDQDVYLQNDSLASETDLEELFSVLDTIRSQNGRPPVITANTIVANPDFKRIKECGFLTYHFVPFNKTLLSYPEHSKSFQLWKKGIDAGLFYPQFHGREHLHVNRWLMNLQDRNSETAKVFEENMFGVGVHASTEARSSYLAAWEWDDEADREFSLKAIKQGLDMFEDLFGYRSLSAIAPNYTWNSEVEMKMERCGVRFLQGGTVQRSPQLGSKKNKLMRHHIGEQNTIGQTYLIRNCKFEPSFDHGIDWVSDCLKEIKTAFLCKKPAIIETHRVNFIGYINPDNRRRNLKKFKHLMNEVVRKWPNVEFMTSVDLGKIISSDVTSE